MYPNKVLDGIDASVYQGRINWPIYKNRYGFVILKCSTTTSAGKMAIADNFVTNYNGAKLAGIENIGVYHFSNAKNEDDAKKEAEVTIKALSEVYCKPEDLTLQVWYDIESKTMRALGKSM